MSPSDAPTGGGEGHAAIAAGALPWRPLPPDATSVAAQFLAQVEQRPGAPALETDAGVLTYEQLEAATRSVAGVVLDRAGGAGALVGVLAPHDLVAAVGLVGVARAGCAYVALDPRLPAAHLAGVIAAAGIATVVADATSEGLAGTLVGADGVVVADRAGVVRAGGAAPAPPASLPPVDPASLLTVAFTSGSTGRPKGVAHTQASVASMAVLGIAHNRREPGLREVLTQSFAWMWASSNLWGCLSSGSTMCLFDRRDHGLEVLVAWLRAHRIESFSTIPSLLPSLVAAAGPDGLRGLKRLWLAAETLTGAQLKAALPALSPGCRILQAFGSSETPWITAEPVDPAGLDDGPVALGPPVRGVTVRVLDEDGHDLPVGEVGRLAVRSPYTALGYWDDPEETAACFLQHDDGTATFFSSDLGRLRPDGVLEHHGRTDDRVKVRGHMVDPGAVETALRAMPGVDDAAVVAVDGRGGRTELVAYVVAGAGARFSVGDVRRFLADRVPSALLPAAVHGVAALPRNDRGKVDRSRLGLAARTGLPGDAPSRPPSRPGEAEVAAVVAKVLGVGVGAGAGAGGTVGADDDLFDLGADSLAIEELAVALTAALGTRVTKGDVLAAPTVAALAARFDGATGGPRAGSGVRRVLDLARRRHDGAVVLHPGPADRAAAGVPVFVAPGGAADAFELVRLARRLGARHPVVSYRSPVHDGLGLPDRTVARMAERSMAALRSAHPHGPYAIAGYSAGGTVALEMAGRLRDAGEEVVLLALLDGVAPPSRPAVFHRWGLPPTGPLDEWAAVARVQDVPPPSTPLSRARAWLAYQGLGVLPLRPDQRAALLFAVARAAVASYRGRVYDGAALLIRSTRRGSAQAGPDWSTWLRGRVTTVGVAGNHFSFLLEPEVAEVAGAVARAIEDAVVARDEGRDEGRDVGR